MTPKQYRKQARARSSANGTSHQAELNAIARENGYANWGGFQAALTAAEAKMPFYLTSEDNEDLETEALLDAIDVARASGGHVVVLRESEELEEKALELLWSRDGGDQALRDVAFGDAMSAAAIESAAGHGQILVCRSGSMPRRISHGNCLVKRGDEVLDHSNSLVSKRDHREFFAMADATRATTRAIAGGSVPTIELLQGAVGATTIKRRNQRAEPQGWSDREDLRAAWDLPIGKRGPLFDADGFIPAWNVLSSIAMPVALEQRHQHVEQVVDILMPTDERDHFRTRGRAALRGFIYAEIANARWRRNDPSLVALNEWMDKAMKAATERPRRGADELRSAFQTELRGLADCYEKTLAWEILVPMLDAPQDERDAVLQEIARALLPFRNPVIAGLNA